MVIDVLRRQIRTQSKLRSAIKVTHKMVTDEINSFQIASTHQQTKIINQLFYWLNNPWINAKSEDSHKVRKLIIREIFQTIFPRVSLEQQKVVLSGLKHFVYHKETLLQRKGELSDEVQLEMISQVEKTIRSIKREDEWQKIREEELVKRRVQLEKFGWNTSTIPADISNEDREIAKFRRELNLFFLGVLGYYSTFPSPNTQEAARKVLEKFRLELS